MQAFDPRLVQVSIDIGSKTLVYKDLGLFIRGTKYANALQNECQVTIVNLDEQTKDYLLTETSPYNLNALPKSVTVEAGRKSYGMTKIYVGNIASSSVSQPPDIGVTLKCLTGNFLKGNILGRSLPGQIPISTVSKQIAQDLNTALTFQARDKTITNYSYIGSSLGQVNQLSAVGGVNVFIDDSILVVKDKGTPLNNIVTVLNMKTGMIGIPELTEFGVKVKFLLDNKTKLGGTVRIQSTLNPAANGDFVVYKLGFEITNRDTPFYYIAEAARLP